MRGARYGGYKVSFERQKVSLGAGDPGRRETLTKAGGLQRVRYLFTRRGKSSDLVTVQETLICNRLPVRGGLCLLIIDAPYYPRRSRSCSFSEY